MRASPWCAHGPLFHAMMARNEATRQILGGPSPLLAQPSLLRSDRASIRPRSEMGRGTPAHPRNVSRPLGRYTGDARHASRGGRREQKFLAHAEAGWQHTPLGAHSDFLGIATGAPPGNSASFTSGWAQYWPGGRRERNETITELTAHVTEDVPDDPRCTRLMLKASPPFRKGELPTLLLEHLPQPVDYLTLLPRG